MGIITIIGVVIALLLWDILKEQTRRSDEEYNERVRHRNEEKRLWEKFGGNRQAMMAADKADEERWERWAKEEAEEKAKISEVKSSEPVIDA